MKAIRSRPTARRLLGLAYRMLGSRSDAEDMVQDAYLRFADAKDVRNPEAFLVTVVTRLCLDRLKSAKAQREIYVGPWLPEPVFDTDGLSTEAATELADDLSFALLLALDRLSPQERAAFLLHDVFDIPFAEVASMIDRSEPACRQLATRARRAVRDERPRAPGGAGQSRHLLTAFLQAVASGDLSQLTGLLREDAVAVTDGGGRKSAALNPIYGADKIARFFIGIAGKNASRDIRIEPAVINGSIGALLYVDGELDHSLSISHRRRENRGDLSGTKSRQASPRAGAVEPLSFAAASRSAHRIGQRLACKKRIEVGDHAILHRRVRVLRVAADMRGQHDVRKRGQSARRMRFLLEHVEARAGDGVVGERGNQRRLVDDRAARDIDDITVASELLQDVRIDGVMGVGAGAHRDHQHAAPFGQRVQAFEIAIRQVMAGCG